MPPGFPHYGVARGALFVVYGVEMGPANIVLAPSLPLGTELAGTSVQATVDGRTVDCLIVYTSAGQLAAVLPSNSRLGPGTITVIYNGETSEPNEIFVVESAIGIFATRADGHGPGIVTDLDFVVNTPTHTFSDEQIVVAWVTGLGAREGDAQPIVQDLKDLIDLHVLVAGREAVVIYAGPSTCCGGVDQVIFVVPPGTPPGCFVPVVMWTGTFRSNYSSISIAADGATCSDSQSFLASEIERLNSQGSLAVGVVNLAAVFLSAVAPEPAMALRAEPLHASQTPVGFAFATFGETTPDRYARIGAPLPENTCAAFWTISSILDNPFAPTPLPAAGDFNIVFPGRETSVVLSAGNGFTSQVSIEDVGVSFESSDADGNLMIDGQPAPIPRGLRSGTALFFEGFQEDAQPVLAIENWLTAWEDYYANGGVPPDSFDLGALGSLPGGTVLQLSGQATFGPDDSLVSGYVCNLVVDSAKSEFLIGPEVTTNFPVQGPFTGIQGVRLFPSEPTRLLTDSGPIDLWTTFDQMQFQRQYLKAVQNFTTTARGDQVVPPTGAQTAANCNFAGSAAGVSGVCVHNLTGVTGLSMNLGPAGENGTRFFFTEAGMGERINFQILAADLPAESPITTVLAAMGNGNAYVMIHSEAFPNGEVRGQIGPLP